MKQIKIVLDHFKVMGFELVELGAVGYVFKYENMNFLYMPDDDDEQFLRIVIPNLFEVTKENRVAVLDAIHETELMLKYVKVCIMYENAAWAIYEHRLNTTDNLTELLEHIIRGLMAAAHFFYLKINGSEVKECSENNLDDELETQLQRMLDSVDEDENSSQ